MLSEADLFQASYGNDDIDFKTFSELLTHVSQELGIPSGLLRPSDRFDVELAPAIGNEWDSGIGYSCSICSASRNERAGRSTASSSPWMTTCDS